MYVWVCMCVCMYVCMHVCMGMYVCVCMYGYVCVHVCVCMYGYVFMCIGVIRAHFVKDYLPYHTIRSTSCHILLPFPGKRCPECIQYRKTLNSLLHRLRNTEEHGKDPGSHKNYRFDTIMYTSWLPLTISGT